MDEACRRADHLVLPTWILARYQIGSRGRRGRKWFMPKGNFAATLVCCSDGSAHSFALRSFSTALAVLDACVKVSGRSEMFSLKWPNDVLLNGKKLSGILLESSKSKGNQNYLAIGVGVNLKSVPNSKAIEKRALPPASLADLGMDVDPVEFLSYLALSYAEWEERYQKFGFDPIRQAWLSHAAKIGQEITARTGASEITGIFETVDADGSLILTSGQYRHKIPAAEIYF